MKNGRPEDSIEHFTRALALHPCTNWHHPLAIVFYRTGRLEEAAEQCRKILEIQPNDPEARSLLEEISRR